MQFITFIFNVQYLHSCVIDIMANKLHTQKNEENCNKSFANKNWHLVNEGNFKMLQTALPIFFLLHIIFYLFTNVLNVLWCCMLSSHSCLSSLVRFWFLFHFCHFLLNRFRRTPFAYHNFHAMVVTILYFLFVVELFDMKSNYPWIVKYAKWLKLN